MRNIYLSLLFLLLAAMPVQAMEQNMGGHDMAHDQNAYSDRVYLSGMIAHHEGAVQMSEKVGGQSVRLTPGEQGCLEKTNGYMTKREVDTYLHTAWKDGRIVFRNMRLEDLFTTLARWYDLEVFYLNPEVKDIRFTGDMDKTERFGDILRIIEQNRRVHFHVKGRTVSVSWQ